jgi:hypothetical protein
MHLKQPFHDELAKLGVNVVATKSLPWSDFTVYYKNQIARNQEFTLSTLHTKAKVQRPSEIQMLTF